MHRYLNTIFKQGDLKYGNTFCFEEHREGENPTTLLVQSYPAANMNHDQRITIHK